MAAAGMVLGLMMLPAINQRAYIPPMI